MYKYAIVICTCAMFLLVGCSPHPTQVLAEPPIWEGLTISKSSVADVFDRWSEYQPVTDVSNGGGRQITFKVESAMDDLAPPYKEYRLWLEQDKVQVIEIQWSDPELAEPHYQTLTEILTQRGHPAIVTWSNRKHVRTAVWPEQGLYVYIRQGRASLSDDPRAAEIRGIGLFAPVTIELFWSSLAGRLIPRENQYTRDTTDAPDGAPEDPFNWDLLTPVPPTVETQ